MPKRLKKILLTVLPTAIILFLIKVYAFDYYTVEQMSMYKTILKENQIVISKYSLLIRAGNVIVFEDENSAEIRLSRVVGKAGDRISIQNQDLYRNNKLIKYNDVTYSYCFRYVNANEEDSLNNLFPMKKINNSGFFQVELTDSEYESIMNDSVSVLRKKLVPVENCRYNNIFSEHSKNFMITIPKDSVFILNDNRCNLSDSRTFGLLAKNKIIGKVIYVY